MRCARRRSDDGALRRACSPRATRSFGEIEVAAPRPTSASCCASSSRSARSCWSSSAAPASRSARSRRGARAALAPARAILDSVGDGITTIDRDGRIVYANPVALQIVRGRGRCSARRSRRGETSPVFQTLQGRQAPRHAERRADAAQGRRRSTIVDYTVTPLRSGRRGSTGATVVFRDVSERARAERRTAAEHAAARVLAEATSVAERRAALAHEVCAALDWEFGGVWLLDGGVLRMSGDVVAARRDARAAIRAVGGDAMTFGRGEGLVGAAWAGARAGVDRRRARATSGFAQAVVPPARPPLGARGPDPQRRSLPRRARVRRRRRPRARPRVRDDADVDRPATSGSSSSAAAPSRSS